jgi:hypothetical protein
VLEGRTGDRHPDFEVSLRRRDAVERRERCLVGAVEIAQRGEQAREGKQQFLPQLRRGVFGQQAQRRSQPAHRARRRPRRRSQRRLAQDLHRLHVPELGRLFDVVGPHRDPLAAVAQQLGAERVDRQSRPFRDGVVDG